MTNEKIWQLIILKLSGEALPEQLAELEQVLKTHPELGFQLDIMEDVWNSRQHKEPLNKDESFNRHLQRLSNHLSEGTLKYETDTALPQAARKSVYRRLWIWSGIAACLVLAAGMVFYKSGLVQKPVTPAVQNLVSTINGSKTKIQLPDGSQVWLNSGSKISYGNDFTGTERSVTLKGEAFFDVVKDPSRPFIIHTDAVDIKVLGTAFNVRSYPDEKVTETSLIRGSVEITLHKNPGKKIVLKPSEKLIVKNDSITMTNSTTGATIDKSQPIMVLTQVHYVDQAKDSAAMETLWTRNKLVFDGETLEQVALKLERWFGVKVTIKSDHLKKTQYHAVFEEENLAEVLYALHMTGNFNYTIRKNEVIIKP